MTYNTMEKAYNKQILSTMVRAIMNDSKGFVASKIAPFLKVEKDSGQIYDLGRQGLRIVKSGRPVGGRYRQIDFQLQLSDQWLLQDHGLTAYVLREEEENVEKPIMAESAKVQLLAQIMMLNYEDAVASAINTTNIAQNITLSGTSQWSDYTNSNPVTAIDTGKEAVRTASGKNPNSIFMSRPVFNKLKRHPKILELFKGGTPAAIITDQLLEEVVLRDILGFQFVAIGEAQYVDTNLNTDMESGNLTDVRGKKALIYYSEATPSLYSTSFMKTFAKRDGIVAGSFNVTEEQMIAQKITKGVVVEDKRDVAIVDAKCAYLVEAAIA